MGTINTPEPVKPPSSSFPSTNSQHDIQTPLKVVPDGSGCRSVKSIVAWLESSSSTQPWSPRSNAVDMAHDLSAGSLSSCHQPQSYNHSASGASEIEDYSLTYLQYKDYFTEISDGPGHARQKSESREHRAMKKSDGGEVSFIQRDPGEFRHSRTTVATSSHRRHSQTLSPLERAISDLDDFFDEQADEESQLPPHTFDITATLD
ncbi:uncharacterized protein VB005_00838 [Metarhizium brunneum]